MGNQIRLAVWIVTGLFLTILVAGCLSGDSASPVKTAPKSSPPPAPGARAPTDEEGSKIFAALPDKPLTRPVKERKILVFSKCNGFAHSSIPLAKRTIKLMGEKTGAFDTVFSEEITDFNADNLARFDAVLFNNSTRLKFEDPALRKALLFFVRNGKGIIGIHAATDSFYEWPEGAAMMGGLFDGHPWGAGGTWAVKLDEPDHPLNRSFEQKGFVIKDEIYQIRGPYSRDTHRVLLSLDMSSSRNLQVKGIKRDDKDFAISWIKRAGRGRVFYCSLGHNHEIFWNPAVLSHYLAGIQYALGDLKVDDVPSNKLKNKPKPALTTKPGAIDDPYPMINTYDFGQSRLCLSTVESEVRSATSKTRAHVESRLIEILEHPDATFAGKQFACRMLRRLGPEQSIPILADLLIDPALSDAARFALQDSAHSGVDEVLRGAIGKVDGALKIGVIGSIASRKDRDAVSTIAPLLSNPDHAIAHAALRALGEIGGPEAATVLAGAEIPVELERCGLDALLLCADSFLVEGHNDAALDTFRELSHEKYPVWVRIAANGSLARALGRDATPVLLAMLRDPKSVELQQAAARFICDLPEGSETTVYAEQISTLAPNAQIMILNALAFRQDRAAAPAVLLAAEAENHAVCEAALFALGHVGNASHVGFLARSAAEGGTIGQIAEKSLIRLGAEGVDEELLKAVHEIDGPARAVLIRTIAARHVDGATGVFFQYARDGHGPVRAESAKALGTVSVKDDLPALIDLLSRASADTDRKALEQAILATCERLDEFSEGAALLVDVVEAHSAVSKASILSILGQLPCKASLGALEAAAGDADKFVRPVVIAALCEWPDATPLATLLACAQESSDAEIRALAVGGLVRLAALPNDRSPEKNEELYRTALELSTTVEEKSAVLQGAAKAVEFWVVAFLESSVGDPDLGDTASEALMTVTESLAKTVSHDAKGCGVKLAFRFKKKYRAGGPNALTDGKWGSSNFGDGKWQGFQENDLDAIIDLGSLMEVGDIRVGFLQNNESWVFLPVEILFCLSADGEKFDEVHKFSLGAPQSMQPLKIKTFFAKFESRPARYVRVIAKNIGKLPDWHTVSDGKAWLFADEIQVNAHLGR